MAKKSNWRVGETRRKYRTINGKRRLCNVTKKRGGKYATKVIDSKKGKITYTVDLVPHMGEKRVKWIHGEKRGTMIDADNYTKREMINYAKRTGIRPDIKYWNRYVIQEHHGDEYRDLISIPIKER